MEIFFILLILAIAAMGTFVYLQQLKRRSVVVEEIKLPETVKRLHYSKGKPLMLNADVIGLPNNFESIKFVKYDLKLFTDEKLTKEYRRGEELAKNFTLYTNPTSLPMSVVYRIKINGEWY